MAILTISRESESGGWEIGRKVTELTGYDLVDQKRLLAKLQSAGKRWGDLGKEMDEVRPSLWEKFDWEYRGLIASFESSIFEFALRDRVVVMGRGGNILLKDIPHVLKIRLFAPLECRVSRLINRNNLERITAERLIKKIDQNRAGYIKTIYRENWEDPKNYDVVFNTGTQTQEQIIPLLLKALKDKDQFFTPEGQERLKGLALAARVRAELFTHPKVFIPTLEIFYDGQGLVLRGVVHNTQECHRVEEMVHKIADPSPIRNELRYRS